MDDTLDSEALQAQIDLSMSIAHELVSSWVKPTGNPPSNSRKNAEEEIKEYLRRPPRLGVGAHVPESASATRETARLKQQLTNTGAKKRTYHDDQSSPKESSSDEEESRANVIRKKPQLDPFCKRPPKKKSRHGDVGNPLVPSTPSSSVSQSVPKALISEPAKTVAGTIVLRNDAPHSTLTSPLKRSKKKSKAGQRALDVGCNMSANSAVLSEDTANNAMVLPRRATTSSEDDIVSRRSAGSIAPLRPMSSLSSITTINASQDAHHDVQSSVKSVKSSQVSVSSALALDPAIKGHILNLHGPPVAEDEEPHSPLPESPSKKRRRRRKKKLIHEGDV